MSLSKFANSYVNKGKEKKEHKYKAEKVSHSGYSFQSKLEAAVFDILKWREKAGEIEDIKVQQRVYLLRNPDIYYIADFSFKENKIEKYAEAKGYETPDWKIKKKLWEHFGPGDLEIYYGNHSDPRLVETLKSKAAA